MGESITMTNQSCSLVLLPRILEGHAEALLPFQALGRNPKHAILVLIVQFEIESSDPRHLDVEDAIK